MSNESAHLIYNLLHGKIAPAEFYHLFEDDLDCLRFFDAPDALILRHILEHGRDDVPGMMDAIGAAGNTRLSEINAVILNNNFEFKHAVMWAMHIQQSWQRERGKEALRSALVAMDDDNQEPITLLSQAASELTVISTLVKQQEIKDSAAASEAARNLLYADLGLIKSRYLPTGFTNLDHAYSPLGFNETVIVAGAEGSGKTALVAQWLQEPLEQNKVGIWFCEMPEDKMRARDVLRNTRAGSFYKLRRIGRDQPPTLVAQSEEKKAIDAELERLKMQKVYYYPVEDLTQATMLATCQYVASKEGRLDFVVVDHIQHFLHTRKVADSMVVKQSYKEINAVMRRNFPEAVRIVLHHLNTNINRTYGSGETKMIWPNKLDITYGGSGAVDTALVLIRDAQYATILLGTNAKEKLDEMRVAKPLEYKAFQERAHLWPVKARSGVENVPLPLQFLGGYYLFNEISKPEENGHA